MSLDVNTRLHTLRAEQFRHAQNLRRSHEHITGTSITTHHRPTLPFHTFQQPPKPSPPIPNVDHSSTWRIDALSLIYPDVLTPPIIPQLTVLCLRILASTPPIFHFIPPHLRRALLLDSAIHSPLPRTTLNALCDPIGHTNGELILIGPPSLRPFHSNPTSTMTDSDSSATYAWDAPDDSDPLSSQPDLHTLVLLSTPIPTPSLLSLPPTLTHLALIDIPAPLPLRRLPGICPLIAVLDLSHNAWASPASTDVLDAFRCVPWTRWKHLRLLGLRGWVIPPETLDAVNNGRWTDVEIVM